MAATQPVNQEWLNKFVLESLNSLNTKVDNLSGKMDECFSELRTRITAIESGVIYKDELEAIVASVTQHKRGSTQELTREEIRKIAEETIKAKNGSNPKLADSNSWPPWKYVVLGAALGFGSNVLLDILKVLVA